MVYVVYLLTSQELSTYYPITGLLNNDFKMTSIITSVFTTSFLATHIICIQITEYKWSGRGSTSGLFEDTCTANNWKNRGKLQKMSVHDDSWYLDL